MLIASNNIFADAAIQIQEGSVKNWIKYYEQERGMDIPELDSDKEGVNNIDTKDLSDEDLEIKYGKIRSTQDINIIFNVEHYSK